MEVDEFVVYWLAVIVLVLVCLGLLIVVALPSVDALDLSNITLEQQNNVCGIMNFTFTDCYDFWEIVENYNYTCVVCNYTNYTLTSECFDIEDCNCSEELSELDRIDEYLKRGYEPIFQDGLIINFRKIGNQSCEAFDCTQQCYNAVQQAETLCGDSGENSDEPNNAPFFWFAGLLIVGLIVLAIVKRGKLNVKKVVKEDYYGDETPEPPKPKNWVDPNKVKKINEKKKIVKSSKSKVVKDDFGLEDRK